jgi:signal transduction histidine kinase
VTVLDRGGNVLARHSEPEKWVGKSMSDVRFVQRILTQKEGFFEMPGVDGTPRLNTVTPITDGHSPALFVSVGIPLKVSFAVANEALMRNFIVLGVVMLLVLSTARFYAQRFFLRPVNALASAASRLANGDLKARTGVPQGAGELNQLAGAFDAMADTLEARQAEIERAHAEISRMNAELEQRVRDRTAQLAAANHELEAFSYSVSHDLRAPLRHIDGFTQMLQAHSADRLDEKGKRHLTVISDAARKMGALIDDLLLFSRMGRQEIHRAKVDNRTLVADVIAEVEPETRGRCIEWKVGGLPVVTGDAAMLRQVWVNLLSNAVKYTRPREKAKIEIGCIDDSPAESVFFVRDNGVGFDMKYLDRLFGVFQRLHTDKEFEGTGIGMANVRRIINRHGGRTWAEGKVGAGAVFYFSMPKEQRPS